MSGMDVEGGLMGRMSYETNELVGMIYDLGLPESSAVDAEDIPDIEVSILVIFML